MGATKTADFSGYATKVGLTCSDGRVIMPDAFKHQDTQSVPLVWQHMHGDPKNVLGHAVLENRADGVYAYAFFNSTPEAQHVKTLVEHGDVVSLSIYANGLKERAKQVFHGTIRELSVVLSGANPGALIDQIRIVHGDDYIEELEDEAKIYTGLELEHSDRKFDGDTMLPVDEVKHEDAGDTEDDTPKKGLSEILATLNEEQTDAVNFLLESALEEQAAKHSGTDPDDASDDAPEGDDAKSEDDTSDDAESEDDKSEDESDDAESDDSDTSKDDTSDEKNDTDGDLAHQEGNTSMSRNTFDQNGTGGATATKALSHSDYVELMADAQKVGSFKKALQHRMEDGKFNDYLAHDGVAGVDYGIDDIDFLFPEAKLDSAGLQVYSRRMEWVKDVLDDVKKLPFSKVRTLVADITADEARAKGYVKGTRKTEEVIKLLRRSTGPATIYKKQKLDRDDIIDIGNDMDIVAWLKVEIRLMLEEELARAILVGDGRSDLNEDKIKDPEGALTGDGIRSILKDDDFYSIKVALEPNVDEKDMVKAMIRARSKYRGSGQPTLYISDELLTEFLLIEDKFGRSLFETQDALASKLRVRKIVSVDVFAEVEDLMAIMVNLVDYSIGTNKGGELTSFEDFDIDFNQHKYLQETRLSGGLNKPFSAIVVTRSEGTLATPTGPTYNGTTHVITIPSVTGVVYEDQDGNILASGAGSPITEVTEVTAVPAEGYYFAPGVTREWTYTP